MEQEFVKFSLAKIVTNQFATLVEPTSKELSLNFTHTIQGNYQTGDIVIIIEVKFLSKNTTSMIIKTTTHFKIDKKSWDKLSNNREQDVMIGKELNQHLTSIAIGTTRGVLHAKTENTPFNQYFIPLIDASQLIKGDFIVEKR